jgi:acyl transferase domain-containing protein
MMAVALSPEAVTPHLMSAMDRTGGLITVGCMNAPTKVTITGDVTPLEALQQDLEGKGIFARRLQVSAAYHSHHMVELADSYRQGLQRMSTTAASAPMPRPVMFFSVTGERLRCKEAASPDYWVENLLGKVKFVKSLTRIMEYLVQEREIRGQTDHDVLLEVGPHPALQRPIRDTVQQMSGAKHFDYNPILVRGADPLSSLASFIGRLRCWGCSIDLAMVSSPQTPKGELQELPGLPAYEFNHSRSYWTESRISKGLRFPQELDPNGCQWGDDTHRVCHSLLFTRDVSKHTARRINPDPFRDE